MEEARKKCVGVSKDSSGAAEEAGAAEEPGAVGEASGDSVPWS